MIRSDNNLKVGCYFQSRLSATIFTFGRHNNPTRMWYKAFEITCHDISKMNGKLHEVIYRLYLQEEDSKRFAYLLIRLANIQFDHANGN